MAAHSSVLAWRIQAEPGGLPSMGLHRVGHDWSDLAAVAACLATHFRKKKKIPKELNSWKQNFPLRGEYNNSRNLEYWVCTAYQCIPIGTQYLSKQSFEYVISKVCSTSIRP